MNILRDYLYWFILLFYKIHFNISNYDPFLGFPACDLEIALNVYSVIVLQELWDTIFNNFFSL